MGKPEVKMTGEEAIRRLNELGEWFENRYILEGGEEKENDGGLWESITSGYESNIEEWERMKESFDNEPDWKILDVNCLPSDILVGDYEWQAFAGIENNEWIKSKLDVFRILKEVKSTNCKYRYRRAQTKPTHEELAEEYIENTNPFLQPCYSYGDQRNVLIQIMKAYSDGRKSMEKNNEQK